MLEEGTKDNPRLGVGKAAPPAGPDEIDLRQILRFLKAKKILVAAILVASMAAGVGTSFLLKPYYMTTAVLAPKEASEASRTSLLQLGGIGGLVASGLGLGSSNLNHLEVMAESRSISETVLRTANVIPRIYPERWDGKKGTWKPRAKVPSLELAAEHMRKDMLRVSVDPKQNTLSISIESKDPALTTELVAQYLLVLNERIKENVIRDSKLNRGYLEGQLQVALDPLLREKIQNLISLQIEKSMLMSSQSFEVLEPPQLPVRKTGPNRKAIVIAFFMMGLLVSAVVIVKPLSWLKQTGSHGYDPPA